MFLYGEFPVDIYTDTLCIPCHCCVRDVVYTQQEGTREACERSLEQL